MAGIFSSSGSTKDTQAFLKKMQSENFFSSLESFAQQGVNALASVTPIDSGLTASSWGYEIESNDSNTKVTWTNSHINDGVNVAIILQYGHGTGTGGYISGIDYINPGIQPIFEQVIEDLWRKVTTA